MSATPDIGPDIAPEWLDGCPATPAQLRDEADQIEADQHYGAQARRVCAAILRGRADRRERGEE